MCGHIQINTDNIKQWQHCGFGGRYIYPSIYLAVCLPTHASFYLYPKRKKEGPSSYFEKIDKIDNLDETDKIIEKYNLLPWHPQPSVFYFSCLTSYVHTQRAPASAMRSPTSLSNTPGAFLPQGLCTGCPSAQKAPPQEILWAQPIVLLWNAILKECHSMTTLFKNVYPTSVECLIVMSPSLYNLLLLVSCLLALGCQLSDDGVMFHSVLHPCTQNKVWWMASAT